jgi:hypothetical protein
MKKSIPYIKIIIFWFSILGFLDLLIYPKMIGFLGSKLNLITSTLTIIGLAILIFNEFLKDKFKISEKVLMGIKVVLLIFILTYLNVFLKLFDFTQDTEYIIVTYLTLPIIFILKDLLSDKIKSKYLATLGLLLLIPTLIYFVYFYEPSEEFWNELPMRSLHYRIRNWICYIGITLILTSIIRKKLNYKTV